MAVPDDPTMTRITDAIAILHAGDRDRARACFAEIWAEIGDDADPFHICTLAHYTADVQEDVREELEWDLRALEAAERVTDERAKAHHATLSIKSFFPSLHLNVADAYFRLGDTEAARRHVRAAERTLDDLPDSPLSAMIRGGVTRLSQRLAT